MRTMRELFEAVSKKIGPDQFEFQGKKGHWRTVNGSELFFPDDGSSPLGMPKAMKAASKKAASKNTVRPATAADGAKYFDPQKSTLAASIRLSKRVSGADARKAVDELTDAFRRAAGMLVTNRDGLPGADGEETDDQIEFENKVGAERDKIIDGWIDKWNGKLKIDVDDIQDEWLETHERAVQDRKH